jgi:peptide/nickel transport system substrate-binding protein
MKKKIVWIIVSCLMVLSLVIASCGQKEGGEVQEKEKPEYGGMITLSQVADPNFNLLGFFATAPQHLAHQSIWDGDWAKGPAGGYGENIVDWGDSTNVPDLNTGFIAESWSFKVNEDAQTVDTVIKVRDNVYFAQPDTEAGRLAGGRKMTTDDVLWCLDQYINNPESDNYTGFPMCIGIHPVKTGPNEITITHPFKLHLDNIMRLFSYSLIFPPELWDKYGYDSCTNIMLSVGTGPYYVKDYVVSNMILLERNTNYWKTDPVGPGKGNQLPYADNVKYIIMPDLSTRQAALRTANIDQMEGFTYEDMELMTSQVPELKSAKRGGGHNSPVFFRLEDPPFNDINVRRAMMLGVDLNAINESLYRGDATLINFPYFYTPAYADLYLGVDDPEMPASTKELFTYNPEKAKQLLSDAGYPNGFKTDLTIVSIWADYYSILVDYWAKIGVDVELKTVSDFGQLISVNSERAWKGMLAQFISPCSTYPEQAQYTGDSWLNPSRLNDPYINEMADKARAAGVTSLKEAMGITKELTKYLLAQVYAIPAPHYPLYVLWWPWLKNYTGETWCGYMTLDSTWLQYPWVDQTLKKSMGY